ncbi:hypothetical protein D3C78_1606400 [compost metagenome]
MSICFCTPLTSMSRSRSSERKFRSIFGAARGSALASLTVPRLKGRRMSTWLEKPWLACSLRPWSSTKAITNTSCKSGTVTSGEERKKAPASAIELEIMPLRRLRHSKTP